MSHDDSNPVPALRFTWRSGRLEAFSDGVFAIAITLLVLDIAVEPGWESNPLGAVLSLWPQYLAYLVSFATIGAVWIGHSAITHYLHHVDPLLVRINLLLLLTVSFLPFPTRLLAEFLSQASGQRVATVVLGVNLLLAALLLSLLWRAALRRGLVRPDADDGELALLTRRLTPGLAGYAVFILLGLLFPLIAVGGYLLVAIALIVPRRRSSAARRSAPAAWCAAAALRHVHSPDGVWCLARRHSQPGGLVASWSGAAAGRARTAAVWPSGTELPPRTFSIRPGTGAGRERHDHHRRQDQRRPDAASRRAAARDDGRGEGDAALLGGAPVPDRPGRADARPARHAAGSRHRPRRRASACLGTSCPTRSRRA